MLSSGSKTKPLPEDNKVNDLQVQQFTNPISKITFEALPRIYGVRKKKKYSHTYELKTKARRDDDKYREISLQNNGVTKMSAVQLREGVNSEANQGLSRRFKTEMKSYNKKYSEHLSAPKTAFCNKRYCFCNKEHIERRGDLQQQKFKTKHRPLRNLSIRLPEIQKVSVPDDIESKHKVIMPTSKLDEGDHSDRNYSSLLDYLRNAKDQHCLSKGDKSKRNFQLESQGQAKGAGKTHNISIQTEPFHEAFAQTEHEEDEERLPKGKTEAIELSLHPKKTRQTISALQSRPESRQIQNQPIESLSTIQMSSFKMNLQKQKAHYRQILEQDSQQEDNRSVASSLSAASISKHIFDSDKKVNTMFHTLKSKESSSGKSIINKLSGSKVNRQDKKQKFQKKNGLFVIPQEDQFVDYLKNYEPMGQKFTIKHLVRKDNFQVIPSDQGVYFGEFKEEKRNGKGLMVSQRQIFEGSYKDDQKTYGCQRNIDGIYKGEFVNGVRQGYGTFQWNNGQVFQGQWKNGTKNGYGIWKSPKGDFYEGQWLLNRQHGIGIYKHRLSTYRGHFSQFLKQGQGEEQFSNGDKYVGQYKQGKPHGRGRYEWADGSYYDGDFVSGLRHGQGTWVFQKGTIYQGQFKNDFKHGEGQEKYSSGEKFLGVFNEGSKLEGTLYDKNGNEIKITQSQ